MNRILGLATAIGVCLMVTACVDESGAKRALEDQGFKDIRITGYELFACSKDQFNHTGFTATGATGKPVRGVVCSGWFTGNSVRTY